MSDFKQCQGKCPRCGSRYLDLDGLEDTGNTYAVRRGNCMSCGKEFVEVYNLEYVGTDDSEEAKDDNESGL